MKKLSKLSLLGEVDILSKTELKQLLGSSNNCNAGCTGSCGTGNRGTCGFNAKKTWCYCAEVYVGPLEGPFYD